MSLVHPYFKHDWLMPRVFVYLCPYKELFLHIRDCHDMAPLICWKVGCIFPEIDFNSGNEVKKLMLSN